MANNIHALLVGVSDYSALEGATNLPYCNNDLIFLSKAICHGLCADPHNIIILGLHNAVTQAEFFSGLKTFLTTVSTDDTIIFYFSGHGAINPDNTQHYFILSDGYIPTQSVVDLFDQIPTKNRIVLIDSCMSGNYSLSIPKEMDSTSWTDGFVEKGCIVLSSCNKSELSGFHPHAPISLFTSFLCEALVSRFTVKQGYRSFEDIRDWVLLRAKSWNDQFPDRKQTPIFRSNVGGTIVFKVEDWKPYVADTYYAEHEEYIIYSIEPVHTGTAKRYSAKVILKRPATCEDIARIMKSLVNELDSVDIYPSQQSEMRWKGKKPNIIFAYFGYDENDIVNANYAFRATWVDSSQSKESWYRSTKDSCIIDNIYIVTVSYYDMMHTFTLEHTDDADKLINQTKKIISKMITDAELIIREFNEYRNKSITEEEMIERLQPLLKEVDTLYFAESDLGIPPIELHEWSQKCSNIV